MLLLFDFEQLFMIVLSGGSMLFSDQLIDVNHNPIFLRGGFILLFSIQVQTWVIYGRFITFIINYYETLNKNFWRDMQSSKIHLNVSADRNTKCSLYIFLYWIIIKSKVYQKNQ